MSTMPNTAREVGDALTTGDAVDEFIEMREEFGAEAYMALEDVARLYAGFGPTHRQDIDESASLRAHEFVTRRLPGGEISRIEVADGVMSIVLDAEKHTDEEFVNWDHLVPETGKFVR